MDAPKYAENKITAYEIQKRDIVGTFPAEKTRYDLMSIITICLPSELAEGTEELKLHRLLGTLLSPELKAGEKKKILVEEYDIPMREELERSVTCMCNLAEGIEEKAEARGEARGGIKSLIETCEELNVSREDVALKLIKKFALSEEEAEEQLLLYWA